MDISSGNVVFGVTCPGELMQQLQDRDTENVRKIKKLQMTYSKDRVSYECQIGCGDLSIVANFIEAIDSLEELSIYNLERDASAISQAIWKHADSLKSLAIHSPPYRHNHVWVASSVKDVADELQLKSFELDMSLEEAESLATRNDAAPKDEPEPTLRGISLFLNHTRNFSNWRLV